MSSSVNPCGIPLLDIGRDVNGRFTKANPGGPGNPFARKVASLRKALLDSVSEQDIKEIIETLKVKARLGDRAAIRLILQYCVGKPAPVNDPDRMDIDEWQRLQQMRVSEEQLKETEESIPACLACHMAQFGWPCTVQEGNGRVQRDIHAIHMDMIASGQPAAPYCHPDDLPDDPDLDLDPDPVQPCAEAASQSSAPITPTAPPVPKAERPSPAQKPAKPRARRESQPSPQAPSANGEKAWEQLTTLELMHLLYPTQQTSAQPQTKPPKG